MTTHTATIVTDLSFGDSGKGGQVDYLTQKEGATINIRFNGGAQAAHNVVRPDGRHHTFRQFGSGMFHPGVQTYLSRFVLVNPLEAWYEAKQLEEVGISSAIYRLMIDEGARVVTPYHVAANRLREIARGDQRHGSCGQGIGETMSDWLEYGDGMIVAADMLGPAALFDKLEFVRQLKITQLQDVIKLLQDNPQAKKCLETLFDVKLSEEVAKFYLHFAKHIRITPQDHLGSLLRDHENVIFEGAQGVLLDEWYGFHPYTTWSTTTNANADELLDEHDYDGKIVKLGLVRAYSTRHGAGPFVTEDTRLTASIPDYHNGNNRWQQGFRVGYFDAVATRYALDVVGHIDGLVVSCLDRLQGLTEWKICQQYEASGILTNCLAVAQSLDLVYQERLTEQLFNTTPVYKEVERQTGSYLDQLEEALKLPIVFTADGPTACHRSVRDKA
jgi:adenylosuccinate synthase